MPHETRYGFPRAGWEQAKEQAKSFLVTRASARATTTYSELCEIVTAVHLRPYSFAMMAFLNEVCAEEDAEHGIMLASLVTRRDTGLPGKGYFRFAASLGRDVFDEEAYWCSEVERIYAAFADED